MPNMLHPAIEAIKSSTCAVERIIQLLNRLGINDISAHSALSRQNPSGGLSFLTKVVATNDISFMYELCVGEHGDEFGYNILLEISPDLLKTLANFLVQSDDEDSEDDAEEDLRTIDVHLFWRTNPEKQAETKGWLHVESDDYENLAGQWLRSIFKMDRKSYARAQESISSEDRLFELIEQLLTVIAPYIKRAQATQQT